MKKVIKTTSILKIIGKKRCEFKIAKGEKPCGKRAVSIFYGKFYCGNCYPTLKKEKKAELSAERRSSSK